MLYIFCNIVLSATESNNQLKNLNTFNFQNITMLFQLILLAVQILLAWQVFIVDKGAKKGYFLPNKTNVNMPGDYVKHYYDVYDLREPIGFKNYGEDDVVVIKSKIILNHHTVDYSIIESNAFFDNKGRFSFMNLALDIKDNDFNKDSITVDVILRLKNSKEYKYIQKITMEFHPDTESAGSYWRLKKFNTEFCRNKTI